MTVKKLSQITQAAVPIATGDFLVGVQGGTTDVLFPQRDVTRTIQTVDLDLYVNPSTGNDSNNGSIGSPFATFQHGVTVIATMYDYRGVQPTLHLAHGTYPETVIGGPWTGSIPSGFINVVGDNASNTLVIIDGTAFNADCIRCIGAGANWFFSGMQLYNGGGGNFGLLAARSLANILYDHIDFKFGANTVYGLRARDGGIVFKTGDLVNSISNDGFGGPFYFTFCTRIGYVDMSTVTWTINNPISFSNFIFDGANSEVDWASNTVVNPGNVTATSQFHVGTDALLIVDSTAAPVPGDLPGEILGGVVAEEVLTEFIAFPTIYRTTSDFTKSADTTLADVTGLVAQVDPPYTFNFTARLHASPDAVGGAKYAIGGSCTASAIIYQINSINNSTNAFVINSRQTALAGSAGVVSGTSDYTEIIGMITVSGSGTLTVQFAQNVASGSSKILKGSTFDVVTMGLPI